MFVNKYHLPHNSVRVDEFDFLLRVIDKTKEFYLYNDLRVLFLCEEIKCDQFRIFHKKPDKNLRNHKDLRIRKIYFDLIANPTYDNAKKLLSVQYTDRKTFKQVWNEFVRDYTEFFAFLGLLPTYYKGLSGDTDKKHYITKKLIDYCDGKISLRDVILNLKYRNSSKNNDSFDMYNIKVRPFVIAIKVLDFYHEKGFNYIDPHILSAIVIYSKDDNSYKTLCKEIVDPTLTISDYKHLFYLPIGENSSFIDKAIKEIGRATLLLKPYLENLKIIEKIKIGRSEKYKPLIDNFNLDTIPDKCAFCNDFIGNLKLTPLIGKVLYTCLSYSKKDCDVEINTNAVFDKHFTDLDIQTIIPELIKIGVLSSQSDNKLFVSKLKNQYSINPYADFFTMDDANYVSNIKDLLIENDSKIITTETTIFDDKLRDLENVAYGSDGTLYESSLFSIINDNFDIFKNKKWYGAAATGKRISDIAFTADIFDNNNYKRILIIIECKAGHAIRSFDERKEINDVENLLNIFPEKRIDGVWYWVVNGNSLPNYDEHGGYRVNDYSKNLLQKLNDIQFSVSEYSRMPTIVTAFSYKAICEYLRYIYIKTKNADKITPFIVPHFWRWSKKFMNLQYVMIHKELNIGVQ